MLVLLIPVTFVPRSGLEKDRAAGNPEIPAPEHRGGAFRLGVRRRSVPASMSPMAVSLHDTFLGKTTSDNGPERLLGGRIAVGLVGLAGSRSLYSCRKYLLIWS